MLQIPKGKIRDNAASAGLFVDNQLIHSAENALQGLDIHPSPRDVRSLLIFLVNLQEAIRPALSLGNRLLAVALGCLQNTLRIAARFRNDTVRIGLRLVASALLVGAGRLNIPERSNHLRGRIHFLQDNLRDVDPRFVAVEGALKETLY